jgi:glutathione peroxidase
MQTLPLTRDSIHRFKVNDINGNPIDLSIYKGKVLLIVNTASKCGFTPQLDDMEKLYKDFKSQGFEILAFPSNDFGAQEPLEGKAIHDFCKENYNVSFSFFEKTHVKGSRASKLYQFFSSKRLNGRLNSIPKWNFHKYLIDKEGRLVNYYFTITNPNSIKIRKEITNLLQK